MSKTKEPINPVTMRGNSEEHDKGKPRNISIGRLWLGSELNPDGANRFNPKNLKGTWEKTMQFVVWEDPAMPQGFMIISNEDEFIEKVRKLILENESFEIKGGAFRGADNDRTLKVSWEGVPRCIVCSMEMSEDNVTVVYVETGRFCHGLGHLFAKGELGIPILNEATE